jgi:hypothetical protein
VENCFVFEKVRVQRMLLYITQFINAYIDPVCLGRLILRHCSVTYLLRRRPELQEAPGNACLMWISTVRNGKMAAVPTYISGVISCALNVRKQLTFVWSARLYCITIFIYECYFAEFTINQLLCSDCLNEECHLAVTDIV